MLLRYAAALTFFTRLPLWRLVRFPDGIFDRIVPLWPVTGWLTGGLAAMTAWLTAMVFGIEIAAALGIVARIMLTGALHDDGFADFCDAFGGRNSRERTLEIMKDSHIGTYGVLGLIFYYLVYWLLLCRFGDAAVIAAVIFATDTFGKSCSAQIVNFLPYARKEGPKNQINYQRMSAGDFTVCVAGGVLPLSVYMTIDMPDLALGAFGAIPATAVMILTMKRRLGGYTGDCCGATFNVTLICATALTAVIYNANLIGR